MIPKTIGVCSNLWVCQNEEMNKCFPDTSQSVQHLPHICG